MCGGLSAQIEAPIMSIKAYVINIYITDFHMI